MYQGFSPCGFLQDFIMFSLYRIADPGVTSSIPDWSPTFVEIDNEIISTVILLPSAEPFKEGLLSATSESMCTKYWLTACSSLPRKECG